MNALSLRHALHDLRASFRHLRLLIICLLLGVAVMSCIGSMVAGIKAGINRDAKSLLGGDIEVRQLYRPLPLGPDAFLSFNSKTISHTMDMRAMAEAGEHRTLAEIKAIDHLYPLYGTLAYKKSLSTDEQRKMAQVHNIEKKTYGAAVDQSLLDLLGIDLGGIFSIGKAQFMPIHIIESEPDRAFNSMTLGPRVLMTRKAFMATGNVQPGSMVNYRYRVKLPDNITPAEWKQKMAELFPDAAWNVRDWSESAPGLISLIDRLSLFFALTGITALVVAGIGIGNATSVYIWSKRQTIAAMKCLGATQQHIMLTYLIQILFISVITIACGAALGALGEVALIGLLDTLLPVKGEQGIFWRPLLLSMSLGFVTVLLFTLVPLLSTRNIKPAALLRGHVEMAEAVSWKNPWLLSAIAILVALMIWLSILFAGTYAIPLYFAAGMSVTMLVLYALSVDLQRKSNTLAHSGRFGMTLSMALANLARPGAATGSMVIALGIGMSLIVTLALVGSNLRQQVEQGLPEHAPAFFLGDIQPSQVDELLDKLRAMPEVSKITQLPMVRGRITQLNGVPANKVQVADNARWGIRGERGLTTSATPPDNTVIAKGEWWAKDYSGPPLVSFDIALARGMGLKLGDTITIGALDKQITATIANMREIQWGTLEMNFAIILSPGALDGLPVTYLATVSAPQSAEKKIQKLLADEYPSVAIVRVREVLSRVSGILQNISNAVMVSALMTVLCSILVMASAIHASLHKRVFDTVMLKVLGAQRGRILRIYLTEFAIIALAVAVFAVIIGEAGAYGIMQLMIFSGFELMPSVAITTIIGSLLLAILLGLIATRVTLGVRPLTLLRNE